MAHVCYAFCVNSIGSHNWNHVFFLIDCHNFFVIVKKSWLKSYFFKKRIDFTLFSIL